MGVDRMRLEQAIVVVDIQVTAAARIELPDQGHFGRVFRHVAVHGHGREFARQGTGHRQLLLGGRGRKTRRDGVPQPAHALPALDEALAVIKGGLRRVAQEFRAIAVHHHLARDDAQPAPQSDAEQGIDRLRVHRAEHQGRGGAIAQQFIAEEFGCLLRHGGIPEAALCRKGIAVEPVEQSTSRRRDDVGLGVVDVCVDESRQDQPAAVIDRGCPRRCRWGNLGPGPAAANDAVFEQ